MDLREVYTPKILAEIASVVVAERSKASDHFRSFGEKMRWGLGVNIFFLFSKIQIWPNFDFYHAFLTHTSYFWNAMWPFSLNWYLSLVPNPLCCALSKSEINGVTEQKYSEVKNS